MKALRTAVTFALAAALAAASLGCATSYDSVEAEQNRRRARSHYDLGLDHIQNGRRELGLRELLAAEKLDPRDAEIQSQLGVTYYQKARRVEGEQHLRRALELKPEYHEARFNLTVLLLQEGRWQECATESATLFDDPTFVAPWRALGTRGWCEYKLGRVDQARELLLLAREYDTKDWSTLLNLGILEADQGNRRVAIELFEKVLVLRPSSGTEAEVNFRLGELYAAQGERKRAVSHLQAAAQKAPNGPWAKKSEDTLKRLR
jgi:Tfp pilus assembly protein PilF